MTRSVLVASFGGESLGSQPDRHGFNENHPVQRLWRICDAMELWTNYVATVGLAARVRGAGGRLPRDLALRLAGTIERPTFGFWIGMADAVLTRTGTTSDFLKRARELFLEARDLLTAGAASQPGKGILSLRNCLAHGGLEGELVNLPEGAFAILGIAEATFAADHETAEPAYPLEELGPAEPAVEHMDCVDAGQQGRELPHVLDLNGMLAGDRVVYDRPVDGNRPAVRWPRFATNRLGDFRDFGPALPKVDVSSMWVPPFQVM